MKACTNSDKYCLDMFKFVCDVDIACPSTAAPSHGVGATWSVRGRQLSQTTAKHRLAPRNRLLQRQICVVLVVFLEMT